jgi:uracil-DNA glycosylase
MSLKNKIPTDWQQVLSEEFEKEYWNRLEGHLNALADDAVLPPRHLIFNALEKTPFADVKVVILGQDPYHKPGQAHGLSFSVPNDVKTPPSLKNIYKELAADIEGFTIPKHGNLEAWASQGVLLLNAILTVSPNLAASHSKLGWELFSNAIIQQLSAQRCGLVFMLWGNFAKQKAELIDAHKHLVLLAAHPSPLAGGAYFGSKHFSAANTYLEQQKHAPIRWQVMD